MSVEWANTTSNTICFSYQDYLDYRDRTSTLSGLIAMNKTFVTVEEVRTGTIDLYPTNKMRSVPIRLVSTIIFPFSEQRWRWGGAFLPEEDMHQEYTPVLVLSHQFWQHQFKGDPAIIGKSVKVQGQLFSIVGVTSPEFIGTDPDSASCWIPLMMRDAVVTSSNRSYQQWLTERNVDSFIMIGRLKPGISQPQAASELT